MNEVNNIQLLEVEKELGIRSVTLERAIKKIPDHLHSIGIDLHLEPEAKRVSRRYSPYTDISKDLYDYIINQYNSTKDFISTTDIQREYNFPKKLLSNYLSHHKLDSKDGVAEYLGSNIFLRSNYNYIQKRKVKAFVRHFFVWLLSNHASTSAELVNTEFGFKDTFYTLEEIKYGNSKKGRILGFAKSGSEKIEAIVGFYNGEIKFLPELQRNPEGMSSPDFKKYDYETMPIQFNFSLEDILDKSNREVLNILVAGHSNGPRKTIWGGTGSTIYKILNLLSWLNLSLMIR